jgi:hypothetical protein
MIKYILVFFCFSLLLQNCKSNKQEIKLGPIIKENSQNRFCFIDDIKMDNQKSILLFDLIEKQKDSLTPQLKVIDLPNGFYFSNNEKKFEAIEIDSNSILIMQTFTFNDDGNFKFNQRVNLTDFMNVFTDSENSRFKMIPFRIVSTGTKIDSLIEIYVP